MRGRRPAATAGSTASASTRPARRCVWEAWTEDGWTPCDVDRDTTGGFNQPGEVVLHLPPGHVTSLVGGLRAGWLRGPDRRAAGARHGLLQLTRPCRRSTSRRSAPRWPRCTPSWCPARCSAPPRACPAQRFALRRAPVLVGTRPLELEVSDGRRLADLADRRRLRRRAAPDDTHVVLDPASGEVELGPVVRLADGSVRQHGAVPPAGAVLRVGPYLTGGGASGNVAAGVLRVLRSSIPYVAPGREPLPGPRRPGRRDPRRGARLRGAARAAQPGPRGHRRGLRAPRPRRGARVSRGCAACPPTDGRPGRRAAARRTGAR